jgi:Uma2 family endonuclease
MSTAEQQRTYTYDDLASFPDDNLRRELIDGELIVTPAPRLRHQEVVAFLTLELGLWVREHGGKVYPAPTDVKFSNVTVLEPDVLLVRAEHLDRLDPRYVAAAPDVVVEVSSPSTRRLELLRKHAVYEREGVPEYWYVDLDADRVEIYRLGDEGYGQPRILTRADTLASAQVPGFAVAVDDVLGEPEA